MNGGGAAGDEGVREINLLDHRFSKFNLKNHPRIIDSEQPKLPPASLKTRRRKGWENLKCHNFLASLRLCVIFPNIMNENQIAREVVDAAVKIHSALGPGLLESVYEVVLARELLSRHLRVERQVIIPINFEDLHFDEGFRADIIVENQVILELKSVEQLAKVHYKQLFTYLKLADKRLGLLLNFGADLMKEGIKRIANGMDDTR